MGSTTDNVEPIRSPSLQSLLDGTICFVLSRNAVFPNKQEEPNVSSGDEDSVQSDTTFNSIPPLETVNDDFLTDNPSTVRICQRCGIGHSARLPCDYCEYEAQLRQSQGCIVVGKGATQSDSPLTLSINPASGKIM